MVFHCETRGRWESKLEPVLIRAGFGIYMGIISCEFCMIGTVEAFWRYITVYDRICSRGVCTISTSTTLSRHHIQKYPVIPLFLLRSLLSLSILKLSINIPCRSHISVNFLNTASACRIAFSNSRLRSSSSRACTSRSALMLKHLLVSLGLGCSGWWSRCGSLRVVLRERRLGGARRRALGGLDAGWGDWLIESGIVGSVSRCANSSLLNA